MITAADCRLTQADIAKFKLPPSRSEQIIWDKGKNAVGGFGLRVRAGGSRVWILQYKLGGKDRKMTRRLTLGRTSELTIDAARAKASAEKVKLRDGRDPQAEKTAARLEAARAALSAKSETFGANVAAYLEQQEASLKPQSYAAVKRYLNIHWKPLHGLALTAIGRSLVPTRLREIAKTYGPVSGNRARAALSAFFGWAMREGLCEANPVIGTNKAGDEEARDRVLTDKELTAIWKTLPNSDYGHIVKLLILTGSRRDEIASLRWSEIQADDEDKGAIMLPGERTKNGRPHEIPLPKLALEILRDVKHRANRDLVFGQGEGGFSGYGKSKAVLDKSVKLPSWRLHDIRRTVATRMADLGVQPHVIEAVLNHVSGHRKGVAGIYNRSLYSAEKKAALDVWAQHITVLLAQADGSNVQSLKRAKRSRPAA